MQSFDTTPESNTPMAVQTVTTVNGNPDSGLVQDSPETVQDSPKPCGWCQNPLDTTGYPLWCKACRARYRREYMATKGTRDEARGFAAGVTAMRELLAREFEAFGSVGFSGWEAAHLIRNAPGPKIDG